MHACSCAINSDGADVGYVLVEIADTLTLYLVDAHVAILSPAGTPGVSEDPVFFAFFFTISNDVDSLLM